MIDRPATCRAHEIRPLSANDAQAVADIHALSFERPWPALDMSRHIKRDLCFGLINAEDVRSFIIIGRAGSDADIYTIATHPDERGKGYGAALIDHVIDFLVDQGLRNLFLEVAEDNQAARALYKSAGFEATGRRPGYYKRLSGRVAAVTYTRRLEDR